jgi:hypothetical protein
MTIPELLPRLTDSEDSYARAVIEADLVRRQQLTSIRDVMADLAASKHDPGLSVDHDDLTLTINREETRLELNVTTVAQLIATQPGYLLVVHEQWAKTMRRPSAAPPPFETLNAEAVIDRIMRMYLRFRNDIQSFEHDLAIAARQPE